jgi:hypothetical protein
MTKRAAREPPPSAAEAAAGAVALYNAGRFWEAHEALEVVWRATPAPARAFWQGLILAAAAMLHRERGNRHGLVTQGGLAIRKLEPPAPDGFPVETARFVQALRRCVEAGGPVPRMAYLRGRASGASQPETKDS